jgi:TRAP transporter TAXI family solute receptor
MRKPFTTRKLSLIPAFALCLGLPVGSTATTLKAGKICTGPTTGTYYQYAGGIIEAAKESLALDLENLSTVGSLENAKGIVSGKCDMAIVQSDIYIQSGADFQTTPESKLFSANKGSVAALYPEMVHILVNRDSGISSVADLAGKKVNMGEKDSGTFLTAYKLLNVYHKMVSAPKYVYEAPSTAVAKVVAGSLDATFYVAGAPISILANLPADANVTLIPATITVFNHDYMVSDMPATTYPWLTSDLKSNIAVWSLLTMGPSIDRTQLGYFLDKLYVNKDSYADKYHAKWARLDKASTVANIKTASMNGWNIDVAHYFAAESKPVFKPQPYFCSASPLGTYTKVVKDLLPVVKSTLGISLTEKHTAGSLDNVMKSYNGECAMYLVQRDIGGYIVTADQTQQGISKELLRGYFWYGEHIMPLYSEDIHLVVNTKSGIESSLDLVGKKVNMGEKLSGTFVTATAILLFNKLKIEAITPSYDSPVAALPKVISGEYDAMFVSSKAPVSYLATADCPTDINVPNCIAGDPTTLPIKLVSIQVPNFIPQTTLSADHYLWQTVDILNSPQVITLLATSPNLSLDENRIADFISAVYDLKVGETTLSPTWDETSVEQGVDFFKLEPILFLRNAAAQYFADKMK